MFDLKTFKDPSWSYPNLTYTCLRMVTTNLPSASNRLIINIAVLFEGGRNTYLAEYVCLYVLGSPSK